MRRLSEDREGFRRRFTVLKTDLSLGYTFRKYDAVMYGGMEKTMSRLAIITDSNSGITQSRGKELGISQVQVSRMEKKILKNLRERI